MKDIAIIGAGRVGTSLGRALYNKGFVIKALSCRTRESSLESRRIIGRGRALTDNVLAAELGEVVFICLPDDLIVDEVVRLSRAGINWAKKYVFHCSGLLPSKILLPLQKKGARTASLHPIQSFPAKKCPPRQFEGIAFGLEGEESALAQARKIVRRLGGHTLAIKEEDKPLYHAACSVASNFFVLLLHMAVEILKKAGLDEKESLEALLPLAQGTLQNVNKFDISSSLTGPLVRGDIASVKKHIDALRKFPSYLASYKRLAAVALEIAQKKNLPPKKIKAMKKLLEDR